MISFRQGVGSWTSTLKFRIVSGCVVGALVSSLLTAAFMLQTTERHTRLQLVDHQATSTERSARQLGQRVNLLHATLASAATGLSKDVLTDSDAVVRYLESRFTLHQLFDAAFIARLDGQVAVRTEAGRSLPSRPFIGDREYFQQALATGLPSVSKPITGRVSHVPIVVLAVPLRTPSGELFAVIGGSLRLDSHRLAMLPQGRTEEPGEVDLVFDAAGTTLAHTDRTRLAQRADSEPGLAELYERWRTNGATIHGEGVAHIGTHWVTSMAGVPEAGWMVAHLVPAEAALAPLVAARRTAWQTVAAVALAIAFVAGLLAWWSTQPIAALRQRAQRLLEVDDDMPWPTAGGEVGALAGVLRHVVDQVRSRELESREMLRRLEAVLDHADVGVAFSRSSHLEFVSRSFCAMFGRDAEALIGQPTRILYESEAAYAALSARAHPEFLAQGGFDGECEMVRADGTRFWAHMRGRAIEPGNLEAGTIWIYEDVTDERMRRETLHWNASHDPLTGLVNRAEFEARLEAARAQSAAAPFSALFIDLDRFKQVNDSAGHAAGDQLLRDLASELERHVRTSDTVARIGGDEFAVLLAGCPRLHAAAIAEKLRAAVESYRLDWEGAQHSVGASIGLVYIDGRFQTCGDALRAADAACYAAKRGGRNRVEDHDSLIDPQGTLAPV